MTSHELPPLPDSAFDVQTTRPINIRVAWWPLFKFLLQVAILSVPAIFVATLLYKILGLLLELIGLGFLVLLT